MSLILFRHQALLLSLAFLYCHFLPETCGQSLPAVVMGAHDVCHKLRTYIVHVQKPKHKVFTTPEDRKSWHKSFLPTSILHSREERMVYSYENAISGFAARLSPEEVKAMEGVDGFLSARPDEQLEARTTHTPKFLGLSCSGCVWERSTWAKGVIVGVLDHAFNINHPSFWDSNLFRKVPPPPGRWDGLCEFGVCDNKLIGARVFNRSRTPPGPNEHGTHVGSIAAGNFVESATHRGLACGTAAGVAPGAHLALYAIGSMADAVQAIDQAINDEVDVLLVSIGLRRAVPFHEDPIAIAMLSAVNNGIFISVAAGNGGPATGTILSNEPWVLTVGASTTDRVLRAYIRLGDGRLVLGESDIPAYEFPLPTPFPVVYPGGRTTDYNVKTCGDLGGVDVTGKVVLCLRRRDDYYADASCNVRDAGGVATVIMNDEMYGSTIIYHPKCGPTVSVGYAESKQIEGYAMSAAQVPTPPTVAIRPLDTMLGIPRNPAVAYFSSRGPSPVNRGVLKPDVLGPGVNVLGASTSEGPLFAFASGTSSAAAHLSGIAALLRSGRCWSPAVIKSAIMTTSDTLDNEGMPIADETGTPAALFATGAGHVNGTRAQDPGLAYDLGGDDFVRYVCGLGYTPGQVNTVVGEMVDCSAIGSISGEELNYPSFSVLLKRSAPKSLNRTVTNMGRPKASYSVSIYPPPDVTVDVSPRSLHFSRRGHRRTYTVTFSATNPRRRAGETVDGQLAWISMQRKVRSPISVTFA